MGWILLIELGRWRVKETELTWVMISKGPRYFSVSFLESWVVQMLLDLTKMLSPILKPGSRVQCLFGGDRILFLHVRYVGSELLVQIIDINCKALGPG